MRDNDKRNSWRPATVAVHGGEQGGWPGGATQVPIVNSVAFGYTDLDRWHRVALGEESGHIYSRNTNPTVEVFEEKVRLLEGGEAATSFATGMAAISNVLWALLKPGDRVVSITDSYGGTSRLFLDFLPRYGIETELVPTSDQDALDSAISRGCQLVYLETPTNPTLKVVDVAHAAAQAHAVGATLVADNTFATPINQLPLSLGADLVVHSATKFLGGHADALGGVVVGRRQLVEPIFHFREINGATLAADPAYLLIRGLKTLALRIRQQNHSALAIARFLEAHPAVQAVFYPGLESHDGHEVARRQMPGGFGGVLSFAPHGGFEAVRRILPRLQLAHLAANLGSVETVAGPPQTTSHVELTEEGRHSLGIPEALIRYSVGIEDTADLIEDLDQALHAVTR
ncbi:MAG: cystathionine gamma-synthase family protein [Clostridia bacterium]